MKNLKDFKIISRKLLKEWDEKKFDKIKTHLYYLIKINLVQDNVKYTAGTIPQPYESINFYNAEKLENLFGLPYTSSGEFAGIWNTNTQAVTRYGEPLYFVGASWTEDDKGILIFEDKKENLHYFEEFDFSNYITQEKERQRAEELGRFYQDINKMTPEIKTILHKYEGKKYGEKTREKINEDLKQVEEHFKIEFYFTIGYKDNYLQFYKYITGGKVEQSILFNFLNNDNKIQCVEPKKIDEPNTIKALNENIALKTKIQHKAAELLELVEKYNKNLDILQKHNRETETYGFALRSIALYGIRD